MLGKRSLDSVSSCDSLLGKLHSVHFSLFHTFLNGLEYITIIIILRNFRFFAGVFLFSTYFFSRNAPQFTSDMVAVTKLAKRLEKLNKSRDVFEEDNMCKNINSY